MRMWGGIPERESQEEREERGGRSADGGGEEETFAVSSRRERVGRSGDGVGEAWATVMVDTCSSPTTQVKRTQVDTQRIRYFIMRMRMEW